MGEHPYRPLPPPPRMRWSVVPRPWFWRTFSAAFGSATVCCVMNRGLGWVYAAFTSFVWPMLLCLVGLRLVRVPVEPPRVRVPMEHTMEEHRDLTGAGYVYDPAIRAFRLGDDWDLDTHKRCDALMRAGLVEVETVEMPSARKGKP